MKIGIIGAGRVGISLGKYLRYRNFSISGYLKRERKENVIDPSKLGWESFESYTEIVEQSDIILIAVPDDEIIDVWNKLSRENIEGRCVIHTSGAVSSEIFYNAEEHKPKGVLLGEDNKVMKISSYEKHGKLM